MLRFVCLELVYILRIQSKQLKVHVCNDAGISGKYSCTIDVDFPWLLQSSLSLFHDCPWDFVEEGIISKFHLELSTPQSLIFYY